MAAAEEALARAGFTPEEAAYGAFAVEGWDINGAPEDGPDHSTSRAASAWGQAHAAAMEACCDGWPESRKAISISLELLTDPETHSQTVQQRWQCFANISSKMARTR
ncbi:MULTISPECIES: hypothetical protein [unclassified Mesorhizobium]|uniref:hypothetical protein n=1 Tax=unclassified Mesorhizobium TaxID=325217 RepID=UPI00112B1757|nr:MULTISPECIES: hypothetical protein [unclassified Mesorhizobium]MBZ9898322.1 hypothetical protein [Mesorhizobium sp. BR1-1-6]TPM57408.1 hypothetical protein FJ959_11225 [Mesorhizobium sp. B2-2-4]TPM65788.1 hypothetical protein FJ965_16610 [Mesorhizobium sp. B2-2-1]TPN30475.1 hypothetical protein FJ979_30585 [Mesorhizobium sp. B1-1-6]TPN72113.1 hypothetical protein FJ984_04590 [Mesorhizobium sp. B1-1-3]